MLPPPSEDQQTRLVRLGAALEAFLAFRDRGDGDERAFLAAHEDLRDLLEPMFADASGEADDEQTDVAGPGPGRTFGDYRLRAEIGRGGTGVVYEAEQISLGRRVALKLLHGHLAISAAAIERFRSEAAAVARLHHPGLVPIHEVGEHAGHHFFTMEFVEGRPLNELVRADRLGIRPDLSRVAECAELVARIGDVLQHAHDHGLVHRDVKPHNVMVGSDGSVRLLDFGLAKHFEPGKHSVTAEFLGTPHYMSPEQLASTGRTGPRSDVFALGIVLYELLARQRPFDGETAREVLRRIEVCEPTPLSRVAPRTPPDLVTICHKALEAAPQDRYESAGAMADDLRRFLRIEPILAEPPSLWVRCSKWVRRHRVRVAIVALAATLAIGAPLAYLLHQERTRAVVAKERLRLVAADDLAFRGIEDTLALLGDSLARRPGPTAETAQFARVVSLCESYLALSADDPGRWLRVAAAYLSLAGIHEQLGEIEPAAAAVERGLQILGRVEQVGKTPPQLALQGRLLRRRMHLGQMQGRDDAAAFEQAIAPWQELMQRPGADPVASVELASTFVTRARALAEQPSRRPEVEDLLRRAKALLPTEAPRGELADLVAVRADVALGQLAVWAARRSEALATFERAVAAAQPRATDSRFGAEMAMALASTAEVQQQLRRYDDAERSLQRAVEVVRPLLLRFPAAATLQRTLLWSGSQMAGLLLKHGKSADAERSLRAIADELGEGRLAELAVRSAMDRSVVASFRVQLANCLMMQGDGTERAAEARELLQSGAQLLMALIAEQPEDQDFAVRLGGALNNLAALYNQSGDFAAGADWARQAIDKQRDVLARQPENARASYFLGMHHGQL
ncbi:MAG: serine/threonine protein kinase, partial [Planctomycetes bacterium]|nr:serine/threonine protein kinase [Planctomycetota bacterium]